MDIKIKKIEKQILKLINALQPAILTISGIGYLSATIILSEFGDFSKFKKTSKMLPFAGLEPSFFQSGTYESTGKMVRHGSPYLRYALINCRLSLINSNIVFAKYYTKNTLKANLIM